MALWTRPNKCKRKNDFKSFVDTDIIWSIRLNIFSINPLLFLPFFNFQTERISTRCQLDFIWNFDALDFSANFLDWNLHFVFIPILMSPLPSKILDFNWKNHSNLAKNSRKLKLSITNVNIWAIRS